MVSLIYPPTYYLECLYCEESHSLSIDQFFVYSLSGIQNGQYFIVMVWFCPVSLSEHFNECRCSPFPKDSLSNFVQLSPEEYT